LASEDCRLPPAAGKTPPGGFIEDGLEAQEMSCRGKAGPSWESIGEMRDEESSADAEHGTPRQTVVSERPKGKQQLSTLAHGSSDLPHHSKIILQDDAQDSHTGHS